VHGLRAPEVEAPEVLSPLTDDDLETYFARQPVTTAEIAHASRAAEACCVTSIRYGGRDPAVIRGLGNSDEYCDFIVKDDGELHPAPPWRPPPTLPPRRRWWRF